MKIGIITFSRANNYGAVLQAVALKETLNDRHDASIVNYACPAIDGMYNYIGKRSALQKIWDLIRYIASLRISLSSKHKKIKFKKFSNEFICTGPEYTPKDIQRANDQYDVFIAGSDQIWNIKLTDNDANYFLAFAPEHKRFSYAASFGSASLSGNMDLFINELSKFRSLLVREEAGKKILKGIGFSESSVQVVCDPVFLLTKSQWISKLSLTRPSNGYILSYYVAPANNMFDFTRKLSKDTNLKVVSLNHLDRDLKCRGLPVKEKLDAGPIEFLELLLGADYIVTTSFHAMAFALIFNVPFYYELDNNLNNNNSRLEEIAKIFNVESRRIIDNHSRDNSPYDWNKINSIMKEYSKNSMNVLFNSLKQ